MSIAWSEDFAPGTLGAAPALDLSGPVTWEWAFGGATGRGITVAIIDSGVDADHPAVDGVAMAAALEPDPEVDDGVVLEEGPHEDLYGHGTACAGIIRTIAPEVELMSVRVLGARLTGKGHVFAAGIEWAMDHGARVINLSLSTSKASFIPRFAQICDRAYFERRMLVCAMNNEPKRTIPSEFGSVFSVASFPDDRRHGIACNPSPPAEWGAPGIGVDVAWTGGGRRQMSGNSFATPYIAGHLALLLSKHPGVTSWQAKTVLAALADNRPG